MSEAMPDDPAVRGVVEPRSALAAALLALPGMSAPRLRALFDHHGSLEAVVDAVTRGRARFSFRDRRGGGSVAQDRAWARAFDPDVAGAVADRWGATAQVEGDTDWPIREPLPDRPPILLRRGSIGSGAAPRVAIVGTRAATPGGLRDAAALAGALARAGAVVVSGLAIGIDTAAHMGALDAGGLTVGVVATGLDVVYPRRNTNLFERVRAQGALVSETWFGVQPEAWRFPVRNRIISALADATVVVEATVRGGARITAEHAMHHGRPVFAMPGSRRNPAAAGCNRLIADGAHPLLDPSDVLIALGLGDGSTQGWDVVSASAHPPLGPESTAGRIKAALHGDAMTPDDLAVSLGLDLGEVAVGIGELVRRGDAVRRRGLLWPT